MSHKSNGRLRVVLCWHMHQPQYRNLSSNVYKLPWTYLHGIKDYVDMAAFLEQEPKAKAVFNFSPVLLEQLRDYAQQIQLFFSHNKAMSDPLLAALIEPALPKEEEHYLGLVKQCLKANEKHFIARFPHYQDLVNLAGYVRNNTSALLYTNGQYLADLITWYHLAWMAETTRRDDSRIIKLIEKGRLFTMHERLLVLRIIGEQLDSILPRYRELAECGQIELSMSPHGHPILPLLVDFKNGLEAASELEMPEAENYPGGAARCQWHLDRGVKLFEECFGIRPTGCWPSEGAISDDAVRLLDKFGFKWIASGQQVLKNSLHRAGVADMTDTNHSYSLEGSEISCFFRDDYLSDLIGFTYQDWHGDDAVNNLVNELETIANSHSAPEDKVISIVLDGENCWEYYPNNGYYFLTGLYEKLSNHPNIEMTTFQECVDSKIDHVTLPSIVAGSWVYGTLSTWIGNKDKNKAWDALVKAKKTFDTVIDSGELDDQQNHDAIEQLAICESSDWFWWFGDYNPAESVSDFESLFRDHLSNLYRFLGQEIPEELTMVISHGSGDPENAGVMRRGKEL